MARLIDVSNAGDFGVRFIRRHDSILTFGRWNESFDKVLKDFEYLDIKGWFVQLDEEVKSSEEVANEEWEMKVYKMLGNFNQSMQIIENNWVERERLNLEQSRLKKIYLQDGKQINLYQEAS